MDFDYLYGEQSESYTFYRTPKVFFTDERFRGLSSDAKILYGILLDRVEMSRKNGWIDDENRVFVYMTINSIEESIGRCHQTACKLLNELEEFGLLERRKQGQGKPDRIYVKNFILVWNSYLKKYENHTPESMKIIPQEVCKSYPNNNNKNNNKINDNNPILSEDKDTDDREIYREILYDQMDIDSLYDKYPLQRETIDTVIELMLDTICTKRKYIRIAGDDKPSQVVKSQFCKLNSSHMEYILECLNQNSADVRNIKQYMLATIYNAPITINSYYQQMVNHDMATGKI